MSRIPRIREKSLPHHIISRSLEEIQLFRGDQDKKVYMAILKEVTEKFQIQMIAYCLMNTHLHLLVHPRGGDISPYMRQINTRYARYYNKKYKRRGHVFSERFKNIVVQTDQQLFRTSAYIHNNPKDLKYLGYKSIADYPFSSLGDYFLPEEGEGFVDTSFIYNMISTSRLEAINIYKGWMEVQSKGMEAFEREEEARLLDFQRPIEKSVYLRHEDWQKILKIVGHYLKVDNLACRHIKNNPAYMKFKKIAACLLKLYTDLTCQQMQDIFMNHTRGTIGRLSREGWLILKEEKDLMKRITRDLVMY